MSSTEPGPVKRSATTEDLVVGEVWRELGGLLVEQYRVPSDRPRYLDGLVIAARERELVAPHQAPPLEDAEMWAIEVKSGELDMAVLGQALFGARLLARVVPHATIHPLAAAPRGPSTVLRDLLDEYRPCGLEWRTYPHVARSGAKQRSSGEPNPAALRQTMLDWYAARAGGLLIRVGNRRRRHDFSGVRLPGGDRTLALIRPSGVLLPDRPRAIIEAPDARITLDSSERVELIHTSTDLYRTQMGKALFCAEAAQRLLGLEQATGIALYRRDNAVLRALLAEHPSARAVHWPGLPAD